MDRHLASFLRDAGAWRPLRARMGPAGIDGLYARFDGAGAPTGLLVSETKYGASRLGMTRDGLQMGAVAVRPPGPPGRRLRSGRGAGPVGGAAPYESVLYRVALGGGELRVTLRDASGLGAIGGESSLPIRRVVAIALGGGRLEQLWGTVRSEVAGLLRRSYPGMAPADVDGYARRIVRSARDFEGIYSSAPARSPGRWSGRA